jgi:hypothetical protein
MRGDDAVPLIEGCQPEFFAIPIGEKRERVRHIGAGAQDVRRKARALRLPDEGYSPAGRVMRVGH